MAQTTTGLKALLSIPAVYRAQQFLWGSPRLHAVTRDYLALAPGQSLLDVGCGPAEILAALPGIDYVGVDLSPAYVAAARARFPGRGLFLAGDLYRLPEIAERRFDAILAQGVLHHLDDDEVARLFGFAARHLKPGGMMVTADPCYHPGQGAFERLLMDWDRGRNVRSQEAYCDLARTAFADVRSELRADALRLRYTMCYVVARV
jgi:SAM-dependent methyltransferase